MPDTYGVKWEYTLWGGYSPRWTVEPDLIVIEKLVRHHLQVPPEARCDISFLAVGAFNKVYKVDCDGGVFVMRVALPIDVPHKVTCEVATSNFLRDGVSHNRELS